MLDVSTLNDSQYHAVNWEDGPLLVLAGPGSGKTRVLTYRIARMINATPDKYFKILGLTFTNKAATEMRDRIAALVPNARHRTLLTTFHSFSADLLRKHGHHIGLRPDFIILSEDADRRSLLDEAIDMANMNHFDQTSEKLLPLVNRLSENDISPEKALRALRKNSFAESEMLSAIYRHYRSLMIKRNSLDFPGLISESLKILKEHPGVRKQIQRIYPYICVDEFQDTNLSQYGMLQQIVNPATRNLFVVADDDQIIYQWNGASSERLWELQKEFSMELRQLPENYRCPAEVVDLANNLISNNFSRYACKSPLKARRKPDNTSVVNIKRFDSFSDEANWVAANISEKSVDDRSKCAVLARAKKTLEKIVESLGERGVKGYLPLRKNEFGGASLRWLHSILRLANSRTSREHLRSICKAFFKIEGIDLSVKDIASHASAEDIDLLRGWAISVLNCKELKMHTRQFIENSLVPKLVDRLDFGNFQDDAFAWLDGLSDARPNVEGAYDEYEEEKNAWLHLVSEITAKHGREEVTLHLMLQELDLISKSPKPPDDAVPCFTIHASKGMEFDHVYLVGLVEEQLPSWAAIKKGMASREMQEERRNCFVAITRAQKTLTLSHSDHMHGWPKSPSRFISEMRLI
ncbi:MAG: ATP-dependent helicase [Roseovarius sp.]|nr:ATP-dependent helicase [Roseovarius sp.]